MIGLLFLVLAYLAVSVATSIILVKFGFADDEFERGYLSLFWPIIVVMGVVLAIIWLPIKGLAKIGGILGEYFG